MPEGTDRIPSTTGPTAEGGDPSVASSGYSKQQAPISFSDLLSSVASDIIDWAPPGKVTTWTQQLQTATKRSDDDAQETRLQTSARSGSSNGLDDPSGVSSGNPLGADPASPSLSGRRGGATSAHGAGSGSWGGLWYRGLVRAMLGVQSEVCGVVYDTPTVAVTASATTSLTVCGLPMAFDAGWRGTSSVWWKRRQCRLLYRSQWVTPLQLAPSSVDVTWNSRRYDSAFRMDPALYLISCCGNIVVPKQHVHETQSLPGQKRRPWLRQLRCGLGLAIKRDLASGINLFTGVAASTEQGTHLSYQIDVLRRMTLSLASPLRWCVFAAEESVETGGDAAAAAVLPPMFAVRLKMNTITFQGTVLDWGVSCPLPASLWRRHSEEATGRDHKLEDHNDVSLLVRRALRACQRYVATYVRREDVRIQCSYSSAGFMAGVQWRNAHTALIPEAALRWVGSVKVDILAGVVTKRLTSHIGAMSAAGYTRAPMSLSPESVAAGSQLRRPASSDASDATLIPVSAMASLQEGNSEVATAVNSASHAGVIGGEDIWSAPPPLHPAASAENRTPAAKPTGGTAVSARGGSTAPSRMRAASFLLLTFE